MTFADREVSAFDLRQTLYKKGQDRVFPMKMDFNLPYCKSYVVANRAIGFTSFVMYRNELNQALGSAKS